MVQVQKDERFRGPKGDPGEAGPPGSTTEVNIDELAAAVIRRMPPITVRTVDEQGKVHDSEEVFLGEVLNLNHSFERKVN